MSSYDKIIKEHYDSVAKADKDSASSTMSNNFIRQSETDFIVNQIHLYLSKHKLVDNDISFIDIGCEMATRLMSCHLVLNLTFMA